MQQSVRRLQREKNFDTPKKKSGCLLVFVIMLMILLAIIVALFIKFRTDIGKILSILHKNQPTNSHTVTSATSFTIQGSIYFVKDKNIWQIQGSSIKQITFTNDIDEASISADGSEAVISKIATNYSDLYMLNLQTGSEKQLTHNKSLRNLADNFWSNDPVFTPNGNSIAYLSDAYKFQPSAVSNDLSIYQEDITTGKSTQITHSFPYTGGDQDPIYDPINSDYLLYNKYIYYQGEAQPFSKLYLMDIQARQAYTLAPDYAGTVQPTFSPDGKYIVFAKRDDGNNSVNANMNLYIMPFHIENLTAKNPQTLFLQDYQQKVLLHTGLDAMPVFSPDGKTIAFITEKDNDFNIATITFAVTTDKEGNITILPGKVTYLTQNSSISAISRLTWIGQ